MVMVITSTVIYSWWDSFKYPISYDLRNNLVESLFHRWGTRGSVWVAQDLWQIKSSDFTFPSIPLHLPLFSGLGRPFFSSLHPTALNIEINVSTVIRGWGDSDFMGGQKSLLFWQYKHSKVFLHGVYKYFNPLNWTSKKLAFSMGYFLSFLNFWCWKKNKTLIPCTFKISN